MRPWKLCMPDNHPCGPSRLGGQPGAATRRVARRARPSRAQGTAVAAQAGDAELRRPRGLKLKLDGTSRTEDDNKLSPAPVGSSFIIQHSVGCDLQLRRTPVEFAAATSWRALSSRCDSGRCWRSGVTRRGFACIDQASQRNGYLVTPAAKDSMQPPPLVRFIQHTNHFEGVPASR